MKRYLIVGLVFLALAACGGDGGGGVIGGGDEGPSAGPVVSGSSPSGAAAVAPDAASHEAAFGNTAPVLGKGSSKRFDEDGNLIGVYAVPYVPAKGNK